MTEILMMTLTPQLRKIATKKRASHPSSIREPDLDLRKLVDKLEQAEITMKLEETENLKLPYVNHIETNTTHINNIQQPDIDLSEKITEIPNIYESNPNFKGCNYCRRYGHSISACRQKQQDNQNEPEKHKEPNKSFYQHMKKDQNLPNKNIHSNNSSGKPLPSNPNYSRNQSPYNSSYRGRSPEQRNSRNFSRNRYSRSNSQNNYPRSNSNTTQFVRSSSQSNSRNRHSRNSSYNRNKFIQTIEIEVTQIIEIRIIQTIDHEIIHTIDRNIRDQMTTIKIDHKIFHETETQVITIDIEIIPSHFIGIITITPILNTDIKVLHQNTKDKSIKYRQT